MFDRHERWTPGGRRDAVGARLQAVVSKIPITRFPDLPHFGHGYVLLGVPGVPGITVSGVAGLPGMIVSGMPLLPGITVGGVPGLPGITVSGVPGEPAS